MPFTFRPAKINTLWMMLLSAGVIIVALTGLLMWGRPQATSDVETLEMYCAAGLRRPVSEIARMYEKEHGVKVELQFGGSNSLLTQISVNKFDTADLYLAADDFYADKAREKGLSAESLPIAHMRPVIAVKKGNPKNIRSIDDLLRDDVHVVMANPEAAAVGRAVQRLLTAVPRGDATFWTELEKHVTDHGVFKPTVNDVASDVKLGHMDAGLVWDSTLAMPDYRDHLQQITSPELDGDPELITICVLNSTRKPTAALKFARYLTSRDRGLSVFEKFGTRPVEGDVWVESPEVTFYCGAVNRRAVEKIVADFQRREGVTINTIYDGCGVLTSRMKTIKDQRTDLGFPDVYMACDVYYLENVKEWFQEAANVSDVEIVIAVPKGSTKVKSLDDLLKPGVRVAIGEPDQCTIGALTRRILVREGIYELLKEKQHQDGEIVVEKSSSSLLVPDVTTNSVDATVAYISDVLANRDKIDIVRIESTLNQAVQPYSIAKTSDHKHLLRRLFKRIAASEEAFKQAGFHFRLDETTDADDNAPATDDQTTNIDRTEG